jgi:AcrR family transcriptional regulator
MTDALGLRERKKLRTRATLTAVALRLFDEQGYEQTTVAEIAAAADVSTRTFFSYFEGKEDVVFRDQGRGLDRAAELVRANAPSRSLVDTLIAVVEDKLSRATDSAAELFEFGPAVLRLVESVPALQAAAVSRIDRAQQALVDVLVECYPDRDLVDIAVAVGMVFGALRAASVTSLKRGDDLGTALTAARRAVDAAVHGLRGTLGG